MAGMLSVLGAAFDEAGSIKMEIWSLFMVSPALSDGGNDVFYRFLQRMNAVLA